MSDARGHEDVQSGADQGADPEQAGDRSAAEHDGKSAAQGTVRAAGQVPQEWTRCVGHAGGRAGAEACR